MSETAIWDSPDGSFQVAYRLPLFDEIDFTVGEGFRRIPRGGIEVGGLLFGNIEGGLIRIAAFRPIECEHAYGPSFKLSDKDVAGIKAQIADAPNDPDLSTLSVVGWYISHSRSELKMTEAEAALFNELFPQPGQLTMLVKPEKFKPTRFRFLIRGPSGEAASDELSEPFILPLPGRAPSQQVMDTPITAFQAPAAPPEPKPEPPVRRVEPVQPVQEETIFFPPPVPAPPPLPLERTEVRRAVAEPEPVVTPPSPPRPALAETVIAQPPSVPREEPYVPRARRREREDERKEFASLLRREEPRRGSFFIFVLILAAVLGCALGYWAYLQLPPATVQLHLEPSNGAFVISWPADVTRDAESVTMRINDSEPAPVSAGDRAAGQVVIPPKPNGVKVEIIAHHTLRDTRGIVRYINGQSK